MEAIISAYGIEEAKTWTKITAFKYLWRLGKKDDVIQEIEKAKWYLDKFIELENSTRKEKTIEAKKIKSLLTREEMNNIISNNKTEYYGN